MENKTLSSLFLLTVITGSIFTLTACGSAKPVEVQKSLVVPEAVVPAKKPVEVVVPESVAPKAVIPVPETFVPIKRNLSAPIPTPVPVPVKIPEPKPVSPPAPVPVPEIKVTTKYVDGTYTKTGSYYSPGGSDSIIVTVTIKNDVVKSVSAYYGGRNESSQAYVSYFVEGLSGEVGGHKLENLNASAINGASLTSEGFNKAIDQVRLAAQK